MSDTLRPCPFCGGEAELISEDTFRVECWECNASTDRVGTAEVAASQWNMRVVDNAVKVLTEQLLDAKGIPQ